MFNFTGITAISQRIATRLFVWLRVTSFLIISLRLGVMVNDRSHFFYTGSDFHDIVWQIPHCGRCHRWGRDRCSLKLSSRIRNRIYSKSDNSRDEVPGEARVPTHAPELRVPGSRSIPLSIQSAHRIQKGRHPRRRQPCATLVIPQVMMLAFSSGMNLT